MSLPDSLLLRNVRPLGAAPVDLLVKGDRIEAVGANLHAPADCIVEEGGGALLLPGLVEGHTHLDKTMWGMDWYRNEVGTRLIDKIDNERAFRAASGHDAGRQSMVLARAFLALGTTRLRTHVDIDTQAGLRHLEGTLRTRDALKDVQQIQIVAFPQLGMLGRPGTAELLDEAMAQGANVLGGLDPCAIDADPVRSLDTLFGIAERHACPIDIHLHEPGAMGAFSLELILDRTAALGMQAKVAISHGFCLGELPERERDVLLARMATLGVVLITSAPPSRIVPPLMACRQAGVTVLGGNDGIRDTWSPYGNPDMLERAMLIGMRYNLRRDDELDIALDCVTHAGARGCGFADYGLPCARPPRRPGAAGSSDRGASRCRAATAAAGRGRWTHRGAQQRVAAGRGAGVTAGVAARRGARGIALAAAIVLVALNLRAFLTSTGPLLDDIRAASGLGFHGAALLTALPMLAMGPMSLIGVAVGQRRGERAGILWGLATIALACLSRVAGQSAAVLMGSAVLAGLGVGLEQALMPLVIKKAFPVRMGMAMGLYSAALMAGGGLGAMGSPWLARLSGAWQAGLAVWALPAVIALAAWSLVTPREAQARSRPFIAVGAARGAPASPRRGPGCSRPTSASSTAATPASWRGCRSTMRSWVGATSNPAHCWR